MRKKIVLCVFAFLALLGLCMPAAAQEKKGVLQVVFEQEQRVSLLPIAVYEEGRFVMHEQWSGYDLNGIDTAHALDQMAGALRKEVVADLAAYEERIVTKGTDKEHVVRFEDLEPGAYLCWSEKRGMMPFIAALPVYDEASGEMVLSLTVEPKQTDLAELKVIKTDRETKKPVTNRDFEFTSFEDEACTKKIESVRADQGEGTASFLIAHDVMYVRETKAPAGYGLSDEIIKVEEQDGEIRVNDHQIVPNGGTIEMTYENEKIKSIPSVPTGIASHAAGYMMAGVCAALGIGMLIRRRKR